MSLTVMNQYELCTDNSEEEQGMYLLEYLVED